MAYDETVSLEIPVQNDADATQKLRRIFIQSTENVAELVPDYWKHYAETHEVREASSFKGRPVQPQGEPDEKGVYRVGGKVTPPVPLYSPEPAFTPFARRFSFTGT